MNSFLYESDLLYPTENLLDPGILHVKILNPNSSKMPVVVEPKSAQSAAQNINPILEILQKDIFDRINIKIHDNTLVYVMLNDSDRAAYGDLKYLKVVYKGANEFSLEPAGETEISSR